MTFYRKLLTYSRVLRRGKRNHKDLMGYLWRRPALFLAVQGYEAAVLVSSSVPTELKALAQTRAAGRIGCPF